jgi:hypothetical protein
VHADTDAAAHHDAVHQRDVRLGIAGDVAIHDVLVVPELSGFGAVGSGAAVDRDDVAARAQPAPACACEHHGADVVVVLPVPQHRLDGVDHRMSQRIDRLRPVQNQKTDAVVGAGQDLVGARLVRATIEYSFNRHGRAI